MSLIYYFCIRAKKKLPGELDKVLRDKFERLIQEEKPKIEEIKPESSAAKENRIKRQEEILVTDHLAAIQNSELPLQDVPKDRKTEEYLVAVQNSELALQDVPIDKRTEKKYCLVAVQKEGSALEYVQKIYEPRKCVLQLLNKMNLF